MFVPVASATDGGHRDCPVLASVAQWPEIQPLNLVSRGQIVPADLSFQGWANGSQRANCGSTRISCGSWLRFDNLY